MADHSDAPLRRSPLDASHRALGARMVPFGGWDMPVSYPSGTLEEHRACRTGVVVFDVSHLGTVRMEGPGALPALQWALTNDLRRIGPGRAQYTHLLDPDDGSVTDDIIVLWVDDERFDVMPNASNTDGVVGALVDAVERSGRTATVRDVTSERAVLAVQGPASLALAERVCPGAGAVGRNRVVRLSWREAPLIVSGTGYTGEDGIEIAVPSARAVELWDALLAAGAVPAALGARDTLRLEAALPLHGHELGPGITPAQAGLDWVVRLDKGDFRGADALAAERARGVSRRLVGLSLEGRQPARDGTAVSTTEGVALGVVTSGNFSPTLGHAIAFALLDPSVRVGDMVRLDVRGRSLEATVVPTPFVRKAT